MTKGIEKARSVRRSLSLVLERLQCPSLESWQASEGELQAAIECLHELEQNLRSAGSGTVPSRMLMAEMAGIRREIAKAQALLAAAGKFYAGWARLIGCGEEDSANYTRRGAAAPAVAVNSGQVVIHG